MRKIINLILFSMLLLIIFSGSIYAQCLSCNSQYPAPGVEFSNPAADESWTTVAATNIKDGNFAIFNVEAGTYYEWSTCGSGFPATFDTELTVIGNVEQGNAQGGTANTIILSWATSSVDGFYNGKTIYLLTGKGSGQTVAISNYIGATRTATVASNWSTIPDTSTVYLISNDSLACSATLLSGKSFTYNNNDLGCTTDTTMSKTGGYSNFTGKVAVLVSKPVCQINTAGATNIMLKWHKWTSLPQQCQNCNSKTPAAIQGDLVLPSEKPNWTTVTTTAAGGDFAVYKVTKGMGYEWVSEYSGTGNDYPTQFTLVSGNSCYGSTVLAYSEGYNGNKSRISWYATFDGYVTLLMSQGYCQTNLDSADKSMTIKWRQVPPSIECTSCGTEITPSVDDAGIEGFSPFMDGQYRKLKVTAGNTYEFWTSCDFGNFDTQLTLRGNLADPNNPDCTSASQLLVYNDNCNNGACQCNGEGSKITWTATYTGYVSLLMTSFNCIKAETQKANVHWKRTKTGRFYETSSNGDIVVNDTLTNLVWSKNISGSMTWSDALNYCNNLSYGGFDDWRLPNINELDTILNFTKYDPATFFPIPSGLTDSQSWFWVSTTYNETGSDNLNNFAWQVNLKDGRNYAEKKITVKPRAICTRDSNVIGLHKAFSKVPPAGYSTAESKNVTGWACDKSPWKNDPDHLNALPQIYVYLDIRSARGDSITQSTVFLANETSETDAINNCGYAASGGFNFHYDIADAANKVDGNPSKTIQQAIKDYLLANINIWTVHPLQPLKVYAYGIPLKSNGVAETSKAGTFPYAPVMLWATPKLINMFDDANDLCGDNFVQTATEQCDDGNSSNNDDCITTCKIAKCGDNFIWNQQSGVEVCDPLKSGCAHASTDYFATCRNPSIDFECKNNCLTRTECTWRCCGDLVVDTANGEVCDGNGTGATCSTINVNYYDGTAGACNSTCSGFSGMGSNCKWCGDSEVQATFTKGGVAGNEECDSGSASLCKNAVPLSGHGGTSGYYPSTLNDTATVSCTAGNTINVSCRITSDSSCGYCGNGTSNECQDKLSPCTKEVCDTVGATATVNCNTRTHNPSYYGTDSATCLATCAGYNETNCKWCGDGSKTNGESCDNDTKQCNQVVNAVDSSPEAVYYITQNAPCKNISSPGDCSGYNVTACKWCGDGVQTNGESCDNGSSLLTPTPGNPNTDNLCSWQLAPYVCTRCHKNCSGTFNGAQYCGDGLLQNLYENCDKAKPGSTYGDYSINCTSITHTPAYYNSDNATCKSACEGYDISACRFCGDSQITNGETCDGSINCSSVLHDPPFYSVNNAACKAGCMTGYDTSNCRYCGDGLSTIATSGLVMRLSMNTGIGNFIGDTSGSNNNGTMSGGASWVAANNPKSAIYGQALSFDGSTGNVTVNHSGSITLGQQMTVEAWVKIPASVVTRQLILGKGGQNNQNYGLWVETNDHGAGPIGHLMFHFDYDNVASEGYGVGAGVHTPLAYNDGAWHMVTGTYNGSLLKIYVDGALKATNTYNNKTPDTTGDAFYIGTNNIGGNYYSGVVDEVRIYNRELSATEVYDNYNNNFEECDDGNGVNGDGCNNACARDVGWVCSGSPVTCSKQCLHSIDLHDSAGDGWTYTDSGSFPTTYYAGLNVIVNGTTVFSDLGSSTNNEFASGSDKGWFNYTVTHGKNESVTWQTINPYYMSECSFMIKDGPNGTGSLVANKTYNATYSANASCPICGNGLTEAGETCDDGNNNGKYGYCNAFCTAAGAKCGDSIVQVSNGETCDDGKNGNNSSTGGAGGHAVDACYDNCTYWDPSGSLDSASYTSIAGWSCDKDQPSTNIDVHLYLYRNTHSEWTNPIWAGSIGTTNVPSETAVNTACGGGNSHRFNYNISVNAATYNALKLVAIAEPTTARPFQAYVYGINVPGGYGNNPKLSNAPIAFGGYCGNSATETEWGETCDNGAANNNNAACKANCTLNVCGDLYKGPAEQCDASDLGGQTCSSAVSGATGGSISCYGSCLLNTTACTKTYTCSGLPANAVWNSVSSYLQTWNGSAWNYADDPTTEYNATADTHSCRFVCANNYNWTAGACVAATKTWTCGAKPTGTIYNTAPSYSQTWNGSAWVPADDGTVEYNATASSTDCRYTCDGANSYVYDAGAASKCRKCGDGIGEGSEACDGADLRSKTCATQVSGATGGTLTCSACNFVTTACTKSYTCGAKPTGTVYNTAPSYSQTWNGSAWVPADDGTVEYNATVSSTDCRYTCDAANSYVYDAAAASKCRKCGDGIAEGAEICDGSDFKGQTCALQVSGATGGSLSCSSCSTIVKTGCTKTYTCAAKPIGTVWNSVSSYTQTWNGSAWNYSDDPVTDYNTVADNFSCRYNCDTANGYAWDGSACSKCGDGTRTGLEECDDGDTNQDNGCFSNCKLGHRPIGLQDVTPAMATITGWSCDQDNWAAPVTVLLNFGYWDGSTYQYYGGQNVTANLPSVASTIASCGGTNNHNFTFDATATVAAMKAAGLGRPYIVWAYGYDAVVPGGAPNWWDYNPLTNFGQVFRWCGNNVTESGETCDGGVNGGNYGYCKTDCSGLGPRCGDAVSTINKTNLVLRWSMDSTAGTSAKDTSGNGYTGTVAGATWVAASNPTSTKYSNALNFSGAAATVTLASNANIQLPQSMTVEAWVKIPTTVTTRRYILGKGGAVGSNNDNYSLWVETNDMGAGPVGHLMFHLSATANPAGGAGVHTPLAYNDNNWHMVTGTYDGANMKIYIDGLLVATKAYAGLTPKTDATALVVGYLAGYPYFTGVVDEVRLYRRTLSPAEILANYNGPFEACDDGNGTNGDGCTTTCTLDGTNL